MRIAIRPSPEVLVTPEDIKEQEKTHYILKSGLFHLIAVFVVHCLKNPLCAFSMLRCLLRLIRNAGGSIARHTAYAIEAAELIRICNKNGITHIHSHFGTNSSTTALFARMLGGPTYSFTAHGPEEFDHPIRLSIEMKVRYAHAVVAISMFGRSQLYRWCRREDWSKIHVVHCTVASKFLQQEVKGTTQAGRLLSVGRLCEQKGQLVLIQAVKKVIDAGIDLHLRLIGDGEMRSDIEFEIKQLGLEQHVQILGWKGESEIIEELDRAELFVLPSFAEGLPVAIMEALAREVPVISTYVAGIPELVKPDETGWLVHAGDSESLSMCILAALKTSSTEKQVLGRSGKRKIVDEFGPAEPRKLIDIFAGT